ncbi:heme/hemin ABC transporter substrate-binding protein [Spirabiliibacterium falconis]|uniref:heme/hemin ABC transporter substrate-binding protein n=1 Tax=Spirabiliibacterium falconis TaxID=572023 RepID=UPI001AAD2D12|nr:ABC transporter substrate-binding protein [Spirabiliibacterium falconis]MBE2894249.1 ABC transporter substrate-binding protein [Spirabiliibacterium falconis]
MKYKLTALLACVFCSAIAAAQPQRIVSAGFGITQLVNELGAGNELVAVDSTSKAFARDRNLPVLGYQRKLSAEGIIALKPSIVIGSEEMGPESVLSQLKHVGIEVLVLSSEQHNLHDLEQHIATLGKTLDKQEQSAVLLKQLTQQNAELAAHKQHNQSAVFLFLGEKGALFAGGDKTTANGMFELIGLKNSADGKSSYYPYGIETLISLQPKVVLISERSLAQDLDSILQKYPFLKQLSAAQKQCIFTVNGQALLGGFNLSSLEESVRLQRAIANNSACQE